jgi:nucleotide-binding universal stress UspA family protein
VCVRFTHGSFHQTNLQAMIKILVPVNFSDYALNALTFALTLAEKFPAEVSVLHCFTDYISLEESDQSPESQAYNTTLTRSEIEQKDTETQERLRQLISSLVQQMSSLQEKNINLAYRFEYGYPEDVIPKISNEEVFDVVIMGTKTKGETIKEALGSVTSDVIQRVTAPVVAVPSHSTINLTKLGKVLFLLELNERDYISLHSLVRLLSPFHTEINAILYCPTRADKNDIRKMDQLRTYCDSTYPHFNINFDIITGKNYIKSVEEYLVENQSALVAMTRRKRTILKKIFSPSITRQLLFSTDIPLLVFHS